MPTAKPSRSPGEIAFDRCFFPFGVILLLSLLVFLVTPFRKHSDSPLRTEEEITSALPEPMAFLDWIPFALGILLCVYWFWAARSLLRAWNEPSARVLRISAAFILLFDAAIASRLLRFP